MSALQGVGRRDASRWTVLRAALLAAAISQAVYIFYRYATRPPAVDGLYGLLFPFSGILAVLGIVLAVRPRVASHVASLGRVGVGLLAVGWTVAGLVCVPSLVQGIMASPGSGLLATLQMLVQHVFLSLALAALVLGSRDDTHPFGTRDCAPREARCAGRPDWAGRL